MLMQVQIFVRKVRNKAAGTIGKLLHVYLTQDTCVICVLCWGPCRAVLCCAVPCCAVPYERRGEVMLCKLYKQRKCTAARSAAKLGVLSDTEQSSSQD